MPEQFTPVTKAEFFAAVGQLNCHPSILSGRWPYASQFCTPHGAVVGKIVDHERGESEYLLPKETP